MLSSSELNHFFLDPLVDVVYVSPVEMNDETQQYFAKLMGMCEESRLDGAQEAETQDGRAIEERFHFVVPERVDSFEVRSLRWCLWWRVRVGCLLCLGSQYVFEYVADV